jgi:geranylgeranyl diphosphate synthase type II
VFHNFTLMHDDIMDAAPLRRGQPTVHKRWDVNTAILSGDAMLVKAHQLLARDPLVASIFARYALEVCEGQQLDMDFERRGEVELEEYLEMIRLKTAVLLSCALQVGAAVAGAQENDRTMVGRVGEHLGLAFQLRDDLLDAFGDPEKVGKQRGGDMRAGKKTWLLIRGLQLERERGTAVLSGQLGLDPEQRDVPLMLDVLEALGVRGEAEAEVERHEVIALQELDAIAVPEAAKAPLRALAAMLMARSH